MPSDSSFAVNNSAEIIKKLTLMWNQGCLLTVNFGDANESFITAITHVDKHKQTLTIDCPPKEQQTKQLLSASEATFKSVLSGIQVQFSHTKITKTGKDDLLLSIPESLYWLEHRDFYRIRSPISHPAFCTVKLNTIIDEQEQMIELPFPIHDISLTGLCLQVEPSDLPQPFKRNQTLDDCLIVLPNIGEFYCTILIRNRRPLIKNRTDKTQLFGVKFIDHTSAIETKIQRYMQLIAREIRKKT